VLNIPLKDVGILNIFFDWNPKAVPNQPFKRYWIDMVWDLPMNGFSSWKKNIWPKSSSLTAEQIKFIEKVNPCFEERHIESSRPGELLSQDTLYVGQIKGIGKVYMQSVVDTYGSFGFGYLHTGKLPDQEALILHNDVLPFYRELGIKVSAILTDNGREYCGRATHILPASLPLALPAAMFQLPGWMLCFVLSWHYLPSMGIRAIIITSPFFFSEPFFK
jgi:hypothetical protein